MRHADKSFASGTAVDIARVPVRATECLSLVVAGDSDENTASQ